MKNKNFIEARLKKDKRFDGQFYFGVKTTGIFCVASCPAPTAKEENVRYFNTIREAEEAGYKPCKRCHPHTLMASSRECVERALAIIGDEYQNDLSIKALAKKCYISERYLRECFRQVLGSTPRDVLKYYAMRRAYNSICHTDEPLASIAEKHGFKSLRQLNQTFSNRYQVTSTALRNGKTVDIGLKMTVPFDDRDAFKETLLFMAPRCLKGVEIVREAAYLRTYFLPSGKGYFKVTYDENTKEIVILLFTDDLLSCTSVFEKVKKMFDIDADVDKIKAVLMKDTWLLPDSTVKIKRIPRAFDALEFLVRAILGQQITVKAATTLAGRIVERHHAETASHYPQGLSFFFPTLEDLVAMSFEDIGITHTRQQTLKRVLEALRQNAFQLTEEQSFEKFSKEFMRIKGIGEWTTHYVGMRGLGMTDSFPSTDLGVIKAMARAPAVQTKKGLLAYAENWRPYRAYATLLLWERL